MNLPARLRARATEEGDCVGRLLREAATEIERLKVRIEADIGNYRRLLKLFDERGLEVERLQRLNEEVMAKFARQSESFALAAEHQGKLARENDRLRAACLADVETLKAILDSGYSENRSLIAVRIRETRGQLR